MANSQSLAAWLRLCLIEGLGGSGLRNLLSTFGSPESIIEANYSDLSAVVGRKTSRNILDQDNSSSIQFALDWSASEDNHIITLEDPRYPPLLLNISDPPPLLYVKGRPDLLCSPSIAIVGSRNPTPQGLKNAHAFAFSLSQAGFSIVSGLALGIDTAAHRGALAGSAPTIAVVGTGLDRVYPASNRDLAHQISCHGALVSEFPLGMPPLAANFPRRNRIISGLSAGCLIVEASLRSGSLITARLALDQNREVFAIPGSIHSSQSKGCHSLIKQGAKLVESADDILSEIPDVTNLSVSRPATFASGPAPDHVLADLLQLMGHDPIGADDLLSRTGLTFTQLSAMLLALELEGHVASLPGGLYQRIVN